jgi:geranylgeranyl diphosphate synthase, type II
VASLADFLDETRARVDDALDRWLPKPPACPAVVAEAMRYSVFAGGKRLRPILVVAAADAIAAAQLARRSSSQSPRAKAGGASRSDATLALPAACAVEMIHTYSLIHDDLPAMDNDTLRRGRPTLHVVYGDGIAILAGDGLHAEAFTLLAREPQHADGDDVARRKLRVLELIGEAAGPAGMVGGQAIDLQAAGQVPGHPVTLDADGLKTMHARKTGALIRASALSGAVIAGASEASLEAIDQYAREIGLAFQIVDDILDVEGDPASLGKSAGKDATDGKPTYPTLFGVDRSRALAAECLTRALESLRRANLSDSFLPAIAEWVVKRRS